VLDEHDICAPGASGLVELPVTIVYTSPLMRRSRTLRELYTRTKKLKVTRVANRVLGLEHSWFRPYPWMNARRMNQVHRTAARMGLPMIEMMCHSSELMAGGSESFPTPRSIERLYDMLDGAFAHLAKAGCRGATVSELAREYC
jgi:hypothetical protein